jgi:hypothetical protein
MKKLLTPKDEEAQDFIYTGINVYVRDSNRHVIEALDKIHSDIVAIGPGIYREDGVYLEARVEDLIPTSSADHSILPYLGGFLGLYAPTDNQGITLRDANAISDVEALVKAASYLIRGSEMSGSRK